MWVIFKMHFIDYFQGQEPPDIEFVTLHICIVWLEFVQLVRE